MTISPDTLGCSCSPMTVLARAPWRFGALRFDVRRIHALCNLERLSFNSNGKLIFLHLDAGPGRQCCAYLVNYYTWQSAGSVGSATYRYRHFASRCVASSASGMLLFPKWAVYIVAAIQGDDEAVSVHPARLDATRMGYVQRQHQHRARITQHSLYHRNSLAARYARSFLPTMKAKATHACRVMPWSCHVGGLLITNVGSSDTSHACVMACQALGLLLNVQGMVHDA